MFSSFDPGHTKTHPLRQPTGSTLSSRAGKVISYALRYVHCSPRLSKGIKVDAHTLVSCAVLPCALVDGSPNILPIETIRLLDGAQ